LIYASENKAVDVVQVLLQHPKIDVNLPDTCKCE
jgi:hypothetical protein